MQARSNVRIEEDALGNVEVRKITSGAPTRGQDRTIVLLMGHGFDLL